MPVPGSLLSDNSMSSSLEKQGRTNTQSSRSLDARRYVYCSPKTSECLRICHSNSARVLLSRADGGLHDAIVSLTGEALARCGGSESVWCFELSASYGSGWVGRRAQGPDGGESKVSFWSSTTATYGQVESRMPKDEETRRGYGGSREGG
jgi:hypothetical protein